MAWVRLWDEMPTDPKWRVIAKRCGRSIPEVMAVFNFMLVQAGRNGGSIEGWSDEDVAAALDMETEQIQAIREGMQGKVLTENKLSAWENRQPKRQDDSLQRVREHRERKRDAVKRDVTQCNAPDTDSDSEQNRTESPRGARDPILLEFENQFWPEYPLKKSRGQALKAFRGARKRVDLETIMAALRRQRPTFDPKFTKHAATWLNGECWADDTGPTPLPLATPTDTLAGRTASYWASGGKFWNDAWGPRPERAA